MAQEIIKCKEASLIKKGLSSFKKTKKKPKLETAQCSEAMPTPAAPIPSSFTSAAIKYHQMCQFQ